MTNSINSTSTAVQNTTCPVCGELLYINRTTYEKKCTKCGYHETTSVGTNPFSLSSIPAVEGSLKETDDKSGGLYGWICPKCRAVMSPYTSFCPNCTQRNFEITCTLNSNVQSNSKNNFNVNDFIGGRKDKLGYE
jgi:predicted amidophosphoribosyltransferase